MKPTVSVVYDERRESKQGFPFKLRLTFNRESDYISLKLYKTKQEYSVYLNELSKKRTSKDVKDFQQILLSFESKANKILEQLPEYDFDEFKAKWTGIEQIKAKKTLLSHLFEERSRYFKKRDKINTSITYDNALKAISRYQKGAKIKDVNLKFIEGFHNNLLAEGKSITTISIHMRTFRAVVNANRDLFIDYPFKKYKIPTARNNKRAIEQKDFLKLLNHKSKTRASRFYLDLYRFSYYCAGINIRDIALLKKDNIKGEYLIYTRSKTGKTIKVYLLPQAKTIIQEYQSNREYIFPILENNDSEHIYKKVNTTTNKVNYTLERACEDLEIVKVSTYSARHSFATHLMNKGASIAFISQSLGHTSISTTQNYIGSFTNDQMKEGMSMLLK